jgi:hypothetical protein
LLKSALVRVLHGGLLLIIVGGLLGCFYFEVAVKLGTVVAKHLQTFTDRKALSLYNEIKAEKRRNFCVFLRPFYITAGLYATEIVWVGSPTIGNFELETQLKLAAKPIGPVLALGKPGEQVGFGRVLTSEEQWRDVVGELINKATCVFCIPSGRTGTLWEIDFLVSHNHSEKTIFIMPPMPDTSHPDGFYRLTTLRRIDPQQLVDDWAELVADMRRRGFDFPQYNKEGLLFRAGSSVIGPRCEPMRLSSYRSIRKGIKKLLSS